MIGALLTWFVAGAAAADLAPVRLPGPDRAVVVEVGFEALAVAMHPDSGPAFGAAFAPNSWLGAALGWSAPLSGADRPWGVDGAVSVGVVGLLATPGVAFVATGAIEAGVRGDRGRLTLGLVTPIAAGWHARPDLAVPIALELRPGIRLGPAWLGWRGQAGATLEPGHPPALRTTQAGWVAVVW